MDSYIHVPPDTAQAMRESPQLAEALYAMARQALMESATICETTVSLNGVVPMSQPNSKEFDFDLYDDEAMLDTETVAKWIGVGSERVRQYIREGRLIASPFGKRLYQIRAKDVKVFYPSIQRQFRSHSQN